MSLALLLSFISVTLLLSASPGPVMINCMTDGAHKGIKKTFLTMLGVSTGNLGLIVLSAFGLAFLLEKFPSILIWIQYTGAAYLIYLGVQLIRKPPVPLNSIERSNPGQLFLKGFLIAATNPKAFIYFGAFFPQFILFNGNWVLQYCLLTVIFLAIDIVWMFIYAGSGKKIMSWIISPKHQHSFNLFTGGLLIIAGILLVFLHH